MPPLADPAVAIRESIVVTRLDHVHLLRFRGDDARAAIDTLCAGMVRARDGQLQHVLLLDEAAHCFADAYVVADDEEYDLLVEGPTADALHAHLARHLPSGSGVQIEDRTKTHALLGLDGPYAWELVSRVAGAEAIGLPYLTFFHADDWTCYRAGKTGEFGYGLMVPRDARDSLETLLLEKGEPLGVTRGTLDALDQCALENFFFNVRREGREPVTPIELQLQWRVSYEKDAVGLEALRRHRTTPVAVRLTSLIAERTVAVGADVHLDGEVVGRVVNAGWSATRGDCVALALLDVRWAHPGIETFTVSHETSAVPARSLTPPLLNNRSLFVSPQLHAYATRAEVAMPPLARR
jgi:glycine cleavage system aminomethyltransferase T